MLLLLVIAAVGVAVVVAAVIHLKPANCDFGVNYVYALRSTAIKAVRPSVGLIKDDGVSEGKNENGKREGKTQPRHGHTKCN